MGSENGYPERRTITDSRNLARFICAIRATAFFAESGVARAFARGSHPEGSALAADVNHGGQRRQKPAGISAQVQAIDGHETPGPEQVFADECGDVAVAPGKPTHRTAPCAEGGDDRRTGENRGEEDQKLAVRK